MDAAIWGFVGVVVGGLITVCAEIVRARNETSLDNAKRRDNRAIDRDQFQLERLEALQEALDALSRVTSRISGARHDASARAGQWLTTPNEYIDAELAEANRAATLRVSALSAVVLDDEVRSLCSKAMLAAVFSGGADTLEAANTSFIEHVSAVADASTRCGDVIRNLLVGAGSH